MSNRIRGVVIALTCMACTSAAAAQSSQEARPRVLFLRAQATPQQAPQAPRNQRRGPAPAQRRGGDASTEATATFSHIARLEPGATFELRNMTPGSVTVTGGTGREVYIEGKKRVFNVAGSRARAVLEAIRIDVAERGGNVRVLTVSPLGGGARTAQGNRVIAVVDYTVILPPDANVVLRSGAGDLRLQNVSGDVFDLDTLSGNVVVQELRGRMIDLYSVSGDMSLQNVDAQRALVQSFKGNLDYAGTLARTGLYRFLNHSGNIRFTPRGTPGFDLDATTIRGALRSDFELRRLVPPGTARPPQRALKGTFGDAGAAVTAKTFSGDIVIIKP